MGERRLEFFLAFFLLAHCIAAVSGERILLSPDAAPGEVENGFCQPEKVHLALTGQPNDVRVSWSTRSTGCSTKVHFGRISSRVESSAFEENELKLIAYSSNPDTYGPDDFCGAPAIHDNFDPPHLHSAVLTDLVSREWYKYRIGHHDRVFTFQAPPKIEPEAKFTFIAYGDMGESVHKSAKSPGAYLTASSVTREVLEKDASLVVHLGDISYADGLQKVWDTFLEEIEPYASTVPYQIVVGNHEYDWKTGKEKKHHHRPTDASGNEKMYDPDWGNYGNDSGGECGVTVSRLFKMPGSEFVSNEEDRFHAANHKHDVPNPPFWFSYDYGNVHFTTVSSEHDLTHGSHQWKWLKQDLAKVDRCSTPWLVVLIHRPLYVVYPHKSNRVVGEHLRGSLEDLMEEYEVDLVLSGHVHAYARTCNMYDWKCVSNDKGGMTHMILGNGGRKLSEVKHEQPEWLDYADREWGYGRFSVHGSKHLLVEYVSSKDGRIRDSVKLKIGRSAMQKCNFYDANASDIIVS